VSSFRVLLIDDNEHDRNLVERELRRQFPDCEVAGVGTQKDLARSLKRGKFELAITDYRLPWSDGLALFRRIREQDPDCPVILYTGSGSSETAARALEAGVDDYIVKSVDHLPQLMMSVRLAMERRREQQAAMEAEGRFQFLFQTLPVGLMFIAAGGRILDANPRMASMLGYADRESLLSEPRVNFFESGNTQRDFHQRLREAKKLEGYEIRLRRRDGSLFWCRFYAHPVTGADGKPQYYEAAVEDIQDRKTAEDALRLNENRLKLVNDSVSDMLMLLSVESAESFRVVSANRAVSETTGRPPETLIGRTLQEFLGAPVILVNMEKFRYALRSGHRTDYILSTHPPGRPRISMEVHLSPIADTDGVFRHILVVARDITARIRSEGEMRRALHALRESEFRYRALAEAAHDMIFILNHDLVVEYVNSFSSLMFQRPVAEIIGHAMADLFPADIARRQAEVVRRLFEGGDPIYSENPSWIGGREIWMGTWLVPMRDPGGRVRSVLGVSRDISERIRSEKALRESEEQYRSLVQTSPDAIFLHGLDSSFSFANQRALDLLGYTSPEELRGTFLPDLVHPDERGLAESHLQNLMRTGTLRNVVLSVLRKDGSVLPMEFNSSLILDAGGRMKGITSILRDITERRKRERALMESEARFRAIFEKAAVGILLIGLDGRLIEGNQAMADILGMSHDELLARSLEEITLPEDLPAGRNLFEDILRNRRDHYRQEIRLLGKNDRSIWCRLTVSAIKDIRNEPSFMIGMVEDISKRIEAEQGSRQAAEALRRYAERLEILHDIDRAILEARTPEDIARATMERIPKLLPSQRSSLVLFDFQRGTIEALEAPPGADGGPGKRRFIPLAEYDGEISRLKSGELVAVDDLLAEESPSATEQYLRSIGIRSYLSIPLTTQGELVGALVITSGVSGVFTREHAEIATEIADLLAVAIRQSRLFDQVHRHTLELESIAALNQDLQTVAERSEMAEVVIRHTARALDCDFAALLVKDPTGEKFIIEKTTAPSPAAGKTVPLRGSLSGETAEAGKPRRWNAPADRGESPAESELLHAAKAAGCAPMASRGALIGVLWAGRTPSHAAGEFRDEDLRLLGSIAEAAGSMLHRTALHEQTEQRLRRLSALRAVDMAISSSIDLRVTLSVLLDQVTSQLRVDAAAIRLLHAHSQSLTFLAGRGVNAGAILQTTLQLGQGYAGSAVLEHRVVTVSLLSEEDNAYARLLRESDDRFTSYCVVPLLAKGRIKGVLELFHHGPLQTDDEWIEYLETMATQAAIAIDNASMFEDVQKTNTDLIAAYDATIEGWSRALELRDRETRGHTQRVTDITIRLARLMGIRDEDLVHVRRGALMHDIGKMAIPDTILLKPGSLSAEEMAVMRQHPVFAYEMLYPILYLRPALDIPYCHHEKWDGSGYPRGLERDQIPLAARVFAVIDVWDALRSDRPYCAAWPEQKVRQYIREQSGKHFDPAVVETFFTLIDEESA
jgi:PAS domain S-box-containing protein